MDDHPVSIRIYPRELRPVYFTSVLAFHSTQALEVIRLALERLQIFEDKTLYELYEGLVNASKSEWVKINEVDCPVSIQEKWKRGKGGGDVGREEEMRFYLIRKEHASLVLADIVSQFISPEVNEGRVQDMCELEEFTEHDMLSNLCARFSNKDIYTFVGSILISINPYYFYSIYNPKYASMYQGRALGALPPHIFAVADSAYHTMLNERQNQSVIISGESGAGKTESTKFLLHHLMSLSAKLDESQSLELITLGTGPVLEAFGNARTVANNNSSRFGKFILVLFKENGAYHRASIEKYLLEKSRIISQAPGERNYHVFYYLLVGADPELKKQLKLGNIDDYSYLTEGSSLPLDNAAEEYHRLRQSLSMLRFGSEVQMGMFTVLSAILQLGNVAIEKRECEEMEIAVIKNLEAVIVISSLLQVDEKTLRAALTTRMSRAGADSFVTPYSLEKAVAARDSMAKALYGALFDWIVNKVNVTLDAEGKDVVHKGNSIGVLDIFGFEVFKVNSFEQFCINYANEQLQHYFNKHIFKVEQVEYLAEGIVWSSVSFVDNQECLDLIAKKPTGLLPLLDEECSFPGADDDSLFLKFERQHKGNPCYYSPQLKLQDPQFAISHYASDVSYSIKGFREKNRDLMRQDIVDVLKTSRMDLVRALIGQPPFAVRCWYMAHLKLGAVAAFRKAGQTYKTKKENMSFPFKLRLESSTPQLGSPTQGQNLPRHRNLSDVLPRPVAEGKEGMQSFSHSYEQLQIGCVIRPSRSFDMLTNAYTDGGRDMMRSIASRSLPSEFNQKIAHKRNLSQKTPPPSMSPPVTTKSSTLPSYKTRPVPKTSRKTKEAPVKHRPPALTKKKEDITQPRDTSSKKEERMRSRIPSISKMHERIRRRLSRNIKSKEVPALNERPSAKYWNSSPRLNYSNGVGMVDARLCPLGRSSSTRHGPPKTVSAQFQASLLSLMERLEVTNPFFVRCIKSNGEKAPCNFDKQLVMRQLRYTGMMETIKIRKAGYSVRMGFEAFYEKYQFLIGAKSSDLPRQIEEFLHSMGFGSEDIQIGKTKVFMREKQKRCLQEELGDKVLVRIIKIQRWVRAKMLRCRFLNLRRNAITIQCAVRCWLAKEMVNVLRKKVCAAVLIQSAWRGFVARKKLVFLKRATVILQALWRGRTARLAYGVMVEEQRRQRLREKEEKRKREKEEEKRKREKEEEMMKEEREKRKRELEKEAALEKINQEEAVELSLKEIEDAVEEEEARRVVEEMDQLADEQIRLLGLEDDTATEKAGACLLVASNPNSLRTASALSSGSSAPLDQDVRDVLFQFDSIVTALEEDTLKELTPSPVPLKSTASPVTVSTHSKSSLRNSTAGGVSSNRSEEHSENNPVANGPAVENCLPPARSPSELTLLRSEAKVKKLKQQFLPAKDSTSSPPLKLQSRKSPGEGMQKSQRENVKNIIAQISSATDERENLVTPPTSPIEKDFAAIQQNIIMDRISYLNQTVDEITDKRHSTYKPSTLRRKIVSPFLNQEEESYEETRTPSSSSISPERIECDSRKRGSKLNNDKQQQEVSSTSPSPDLRDIRKDKSLLSTSSVPCAGGGEDVSPEEGGDLDFNPPKIKDDLFKMDKDQLHNLLISECPTREESMLSQDQMEETVLSREHTDNENGIDMHQSDQETLEKHPVSTVHDKAVQTCHEHSNHHNWQDTPPAIPPRSATHSSTDFTRRSTVSRTPQHHRQLGSTPSTYSSSYIVEGGNDDDHLVDIVLPYRSAGSKKEERQEQFSSFRSSSVSQLKNVKPLKWPASQRNITDPTIMNDRFLSFNCLKDESRTARSQEIQKFAEDERRMSMHSVDIVLGVKENGIPSSRPRLSVSGNSQSTDHFSQSCQYDRLPKMRSDYDHLPPLEQRMDSESMYRTRTRTSSDVTQQPRPYRREDDFTASEVVPREYQSTEHRFNSLQRRKRDTFSLTDPEEILKRGGIPPLEEPTDLTNSLTPEEIINLNQHQSISSPSERVRIFSFTKKHIRLPFSKSKGKRDKDLRDKLVSPVKEQLLQQYIQQKQQQPQQQHHQGSIILSGKQQHHRQGSTTLPGKYKHSTPISVKSTHPDKLDGSSSSRRGSKYPAALAHNFKQATVSKFSVYSCATCSKGFTGYMKQGLKCVDCNIMVHRHCEERAPACKAHIESGVYVTMSRRKIIRKAEDLDDLARFLLEKIAVLARDSSQNSVVDKVFKHSLKEFHTFLISTYSLSLQSSVDTPKKEGGPTANPEEPKINLTLSQLVSNFDNIFRGIAKREGLNDPCHICIGVNQIRTFLDEFGKARRTRKYSSNINPFDLRRKNTHGSDIQPKLHKGHQFLPQQFNLKTVCEHCSKNIPLLERGDVCLVCGYTCHEACMKKVHKKCDGKIRNKPIPEYQPNPKVASNQFGVSIENLGINNAKIPPILEKCFHYIEANGLYTQGVYRKSAGVSSKKAVRAALEEKPENADLEGYSVHAVAATVGGFFRELPEPLLTRDMYMEFLRAMDLTNKKERQKTLHKLISHLPEVNHAVFERLVFHLARIAQHEHINRMGSGNLAIIFAPCLLQGMDRNPEEMLKDIAKQTSCLEAIITEQVEKLTATIRGIRTLESFARETETKLSKFYESSDSGSALSTLKETPPIAQRPRIHMTDDERKRLTCTLEEIERERVELTVNLPKLEPYISMDLSNEDEEEEGPAFLNSDTLTPSPSSSPITALSRSQRMFSPITESGQEMQLSTSNGNTPTMVQGSSSPGNAGGSIGVGGRKSSTTSIRNQSTTPAIMVDKPGEEVLPVLNSGPILVCLTKNRVSRRPPIREPSKMQRRRSAALSLRALDVAIFAPHTSAYSPLHPFFDTSSSHSEIEEKIFVETTV